MICQGKTLMWQYGGNMKPKIIPHRNRGQFRASGYYSSIQFKNNVYEGFPMRSVSEDGYYFLCVRKINSKSDMSEIAFSPPIGVIDI